MRRVYNRLRADIDEELRHHVEERYERLLDEGLDPEEARSEAERLFGDRERIRGELESLAGEGTWRWRLRELVRSVVSDVMYAFRGVRKNPTFAVSTVSTLALGIAAVASIFAVADALVFRPLPYADHDRWVQVSQLMDDGINTRPLARDRLLGWQEAAQGFLDEWIVFQWAGLSRTDGGHVERLDVLALSPGVDALLDLPIGVGRSIGVEDALPGAPPVAVLTPRYWERLGRDPGVIGTVMDLEGTAATVVGVLRDRTKFPPESRDIDVWIPMRADLTYLDRGIGGVGGVWALLPPHVSLAAAQDRADVLAAGLEERLPGPQSWRIRLTPIGAGRGESVGNTIRALGATVVFMFLIALLNGVNLHLVRTTSRQRELGLRVALGASRTRLLRQLTTEGVVTGVLAGALAVVLAWGAVTGIRQVLPTIISYMSPHAFTVERRTLLMAFFAATVAGLVLGLIPAVSIVRSNPSTSLKGRDNDDSRTRRRFRDGLVIGQVALSMSLLVAAALLVNGYARLHAVDVGFDPERLAVAAFEPSPTRYPSPEERTRFAERLEQALEERPEIDAVTLTASARAHSGATLEAEGLPVRSDQPELVPWTAVSPDYLETLDIPLLEGRPLDEGDVAARGVIVDRDLARFLWEGRSPIGLRFRVDEGEWLRVVGLVEELRLIGRDERAGPYQYLMYRDPEGWSRRVGLTMRTAGGGPEELVPLFQQVLRELDPEQSFWHARTAGDDLAFSEEEPRFVLTLMGILALVAVSLAAIGLYGVLAYTVSRRKHDLGVRLTLGALPGRLVAGVVGEGVAVAGIGIVLGLLLVYQASPWMERILYDVSPRDPTTLGFTTLFFLVLAAVAAFVPAHRIRRVDPVDVLRTE